MNISINDTQEHLVNLTGVLGSSRAEIVKFYLLCVLAIIGIPLNLTTLVLSSLQYSRAPSRALLVQIHRSIVDFLFVSIYTSSQLYMLEAHMGTWSLGKGMCKVTYFMRHFCFSLSSNLVVVIAMDRWKSVQKITRVQGNKSIRTMNIMLGVAWALSVVIALPILFVKTTAKLFGNDSYCVYVWVSRDNVHKYLTEPPLVEKLFVFYDVPSKFWIPFVLVCVIYSDVSRRLRKQLRGYQSCTTLYPNSRLAPKTSQTPKPKTSNQLNQPMELTPSHSQSQADTKRRHSRAGALLRRMTTTSEDRRISLASQWRGVRAIRRGIYFAVIIIFVHVLSCMPYSTLSLYMVFGRPTDMDTPGTFFDLLIIAGSVVNPIVYKHSLR